MSFILLITSVHILYINKDRNKLRNNKLKYKIFANIHAKQVLELNFPNLNLPLFAHYS